MSRKKIILIAAIVLITAAATAAFLLWNKPHKDVKDASGLTVNARELYSQYVSDSAKASAAYTDKILQVTGEVARLSANQQNQQIILLKTTVPGAYINCTMEENSQTIKEGGIVTIKGICSGYMGGDADMGLPGDVFLVRGYPTTK